MSNRCNTLACLCFGLSAMMASGASAAGAIRLQTGFTGAGKCLDIVNDGVNDKLTMAPCGNFSGQFWHMEPSEKQGYVRFRTDFTGEARCLDVINDGRNDKVHMAACGDFSGQYWRAAAEADGSHLSNMFTGTGRCLDIVNDGRNNKLTLAACGNYSGQYWKMSNQP